MCGRRLQAVSTIRASRLLLLSVLPLAAGTVAKAQSLVAIGSRLYTFAKIKTTRISTGDVSPDNDGQVDRDLLLMPAKGRRDKNTPALTASPTRRFLVLEWRYCVGVNGMALYKRVGVPRHGGSLRYRLLAPNLTVHIAHGAEKDGEKERTDSGLFLVVRAWRGMNDRYLEFGELVSHPSQEVARGSYDTRTGRIRLYRPSR